MSRDYKNSGRSASKKNAPKKKSSNRKDSHPQQNGSKGIVVVALIAAVCGGLFVYFLNYLSKQKPATQVVENRSEPQPEKNQPQKPQQKPATKPAPKKRSSEQKKVANTTSKTQKQKTVQKPTETKIKPKYEFYTILPEMEVVIPEEELTMPEKSTKQTKTFSVPENIEKGNYVIQAGSFKNLNDADRQKAQLALLGIQATIQAVDISQNDRRYRIRITNLKTLEKITSTRKKLADNNISSILIRIKQSRDRR